MTNLFAEKADKKPAHWSKYINDESPVSVEQTKRTDTAQWYDLGIQSFRDLIGSEKEL